MFVEKYLTFFIQIFIYIYIFALGFFFFFSALSICCWKLISSLVAQTKHWKVWLIRFWSLHPQRCTDLTHPQATWSVLALRQTPEILYNLKLILWLFFSSSVPEFKFQLIIEQIAKFMSFSDYGVDYGFRYFLIFLKCLPTYRNEIIYLAMLWRFFVLWKIIIIMFCQGLWTSFSEEN